MADEKEQGRKLSEKEVVAVIRRLLQTTQSAEEASSSVGREQEAPAVLDTILEVIGHIIGPGVEVILEAVHVAHGDLDIVLDVVADIAFDVAKEVVIHVFVDLVLDLFLRPIDTTSMGSGELGLELKARVERAKQVVAIATEKTPAPSSRELALLRRVILRSQQK